MELIHTGKLLNKKKVQDFLLRLKSTLNLSDEELQDSLCLSSKEYRQVLSGTRELELLKLCGLASEYQINLDALFDGKVDFEVLRQHRRGNPDFLPEKYTRGAFSKKRLIHTILTYTELRYGWQLRENILSYFQMSHAIHANPDDKINVYLFEDVLKYLLKLNLTLRDVEHIGQTSLLSTRNTTFEAELAHSQSPQQLFEKYFEELIFFIEHNNSYKIKQSTGTYCVVESHEIPENLDLFEVSFIGGPLRCVYRTGAIQVATRYMGLPAAKVVETKCVHRGDEVCTFVINYEHLRHQPVGI